MLPFLTTYSARIALVLLFLALACVDPEESILRGTSDIIVVDGTITNLPEPQIIRINRSRADRLTGRFGTTPIAKATVEVVIDSSQVITCHETIDGSYQLPGDFKGQVGHAYQLQFSLSDGPRYQSTQQIMQSVPGIAKIDVRFNPKSLSPNLLDGYTAGHDFLIDVQDPANQHNYYRWDWTLFEKQEWCRSCQIGVYVVNCILPHVYKDQKYYVSGDQICENCFSPVELFDRDQPPVPKGAWFNDYTCRTQCWEILHSYLIDIFDDQYTNGSLIVKRNVVQIPFYDHNPGLVDLRQASLTKDAYQYYKLFRDQTQNTGGLADTPPTALVGNVHNMTNNHEPVVGYFTASAVTLIHYWLDRKDAYGVSLGTLDPTQPAEQLGGELFFALNRRQPHPEPNPPYLREGPGVFIWGGPPRVPTAVCVPSDSRTPFKPEGWRD